MYLLLTTVNKTRTEILRSHTDVMTKKTLFSKKKICAASVTVLENEAVQRLQRVQSKQASACRFKVYHH